MIALLRNNGDPSRQLCQNPPQLRYKYVQLFELMKQIIVGEGKLKNAGFGNFEVKRKQDRKGRNPQTGAEMTITARSILSYHPSVVLKNRINGISKVA